MCVCVCVYCVLCVLNSYQGGLAQQPASPEQVPDGHVEVVGATAPI